jgi:hypothetical protein
MWNLKIYLDIFGSLSPTVNYLLADKFLVLNEHVPITVAARSKAVFARSNTGIVGVCFYAVYVR